MMYHYTIMICDERRIPRSSANQGKLTSWMDGFAISASIGCMIHCLAFPLLVAALPAFSDLLDTGEAFHLIMLAAAVPTSALALIGGWRQHRAFVPLLTGMAGLVLMAAAIAFARTEALEIAITVAGSLLLASAHIANWRNRRCAARNVCPLQREPNAAPQC